MAIFKNFRKGFKKTIPKVRKGIRTAAKAYLGVARSGAVKTYRKTGKWSSTAIAKSLSNLQRKVASSSEYKFLDQIHTTGAADVALRQFYKIQAASVLATVGNTTTAGTAGYFLQLITPPARGDDQGSFDGKKYSMESIQWKGSLYADGTNKDISLRMMIVEYADEDMDAFAMNEFLRVDNNSEFSTFSKRNSDFKNYKVIASRNVRLSSGTTLRYDFNLMARPKRLIKIMDADDTVISHRYYCVIVGSPDVATQLSQANYIGNTKIRFIN